MKKIITIVLIAITFFSSCEKALEESPKASAVEVFYNTRPEVETAVNAIYSPLREANCLGGLYPAQLETYGDYVYGRGSYGPLNGYQTLDNTNITRTGQVWDLMYRGIRNANLVIQNAPGGTAISPEDVDRFVAEAKFMRAFIYFQLVQNWAGVPIRTEANMTEQNVERNTAAEVFTLIVEDLQAAEAKLPETVSISGHPTKFSASAMLADVYMHQQKFAEAAAKADEIINSGRYSLVPVAVSDDFDKISGADVTTSPEEIFYIKFSRQGNNQGWQYVMFAHHPGARFHGAGGFFGHYTDTVQNSIIRTWDRQDLRRTFNLYPYNIGLGAHTYLFKKFKDPAASTQLSAGNDYPFYKYSDILLLYAEAASRANNGPTALATERLNMVHRRAYGYTPTAPSPVDFVAANYNAQTFLDEVIKERGYETVYEAKRWLELKRLGIAKTRIKEIKNVDVADKFLLWPIPLSELNYNKALDPAVDQNPGY